MSVYYVKTCDYTFLLGSTSMIANIVAGAVLISMNAYTIGDTVGDVVEKNIAHYKN